MIITDDQFTEQYTFKKNHLDNNASFDGEMFETYGEEHAFVVAHDNHFIWTYQDDDNGNPCIASGYHYVNRIGYLISNEPWTADTYVQLPITTEE